MPDFKMVEVAGLETLLESMEKQNPKNVTKNARRTKKSIVVDMTETISSNSDK